MSTREIQDIIFQPCIFRLRNGGSTEGMIVARYNIKEARVEYYFIPSGSVNDYMKAKLNQEREAHNRLGNQIDAGTIIHAEVLN